MSPSVVPRRFDRFLEDDFLRIGEPVLARAMAIDGQRLLLSGATGFFGRNLLALLALLARRGASFEVSALSRDPESFFAAQPWARELPWLRLQRGDAGAPWPMAATGMRQDRPSLLLHAATDTAADAHRDLPAVFDGIVAGTRRALECAAAAGVRRLLLTGSGAQYGAIAPGPRGEGVDETSLLACAAPDPGSAYGEGKRVAELLAALHAQRHGTAVIHTRCFAFVGPGLPLGGHFVIGNLIRDALAGQPLTLRSDGSAVRSWLYGADLALWLLLLLLEAPAGMAVNVGSDEALSVLQAARRVRDRLAPGLEVSAGPARPDEPRSFYLPALARARSLGLDVWTPLDLALVRSAAWQRACSAAAH